MTGEVIMFEEGSQGIMFSTCLIVIVFLEQFIIVQFKLYDAK